MGIRTDERPHGDVASGDLTGWLGIVLYSFVVVVLVVATAVGLVLGAMAWWR